MQKLVLWNAIWGIFIFPQRGEAISRKGIEGFKWVEGTSGNHLRIYGLSGNIIYLDPEESKEFWSLMTGLEYPPKQEVDTNVK